MLPTDTKQEDIPEKLHKDGIIRSPYLFRLLLPFYKIPPAIEPGAYKLTKNMHLFAVLDTLAKMPYQQWITLVPGLRKEQVAERMKKKFNWNDEKEKEFLSISKEGYLFPDTYLLFTDIGGKEAAEFLEARFNEKFDAKLQADLLAQDVRTDTAVKIASLIERESGGDDDKALIAGVIWNRLNTNMRLQIDAVTQYSEGTPGNWWAPVVPSDLRKDALYNTYRNDGLPPGPICSPSLASIRAAVYPQETDCLFYLHSRDKKIHCAKTYEEHLENIQTYLR